jgi:hypothetical protein
MYATGDMNTPKAKIHTSLANAPVTKDDIDRKNRDLQRRIADEGGAYFMKDDLEKINFVLALEIKQANKRVINEHR